MKIASLKRAAATWRVLVLVGVTALAAPVPAGAHHSFAMYEKDKVLTLKGEVKTFQWTNPHCVLWFIVKPEGGGEPQEWGVETTSPGVLTRSGWTRNSIKPGDHVSVEFNPLRDGTHGGGMNSVTLLDTGQKLTTGFSNPKDDTK
jgi:Family of unknown function (DUF6152)